MSPQRVPSHSQCRRPTIAQVVLLTSLLAVCVVGIMSSAAQSTQDNAASSSKEERELEDTVPKHLPIKVKLKKEKEKAFKDLKNEKWVRDLELEVTNTGDKPIYLLHFTLELPGITDETGYNIGFVLHYGRAELGNDGVKPEADDVPIKPGETYVFKIGKGQALGWESLVKKQNKPQPKKVILYFGTLSFGDGTGFWTTDGIPFPNEPKERSSLGRCRPEPYKSDPKALELQHAPLDGRPKTLTTDILPASFLPVNFLSVELSKPISLKPNPQPQECCPGNGCARIKRRFETSCLDCEPIGRYDTVSCGDPSGTCLQSIPRSIRCIVEETGFTYLCLDYRFISCGGTTPPPTPVPTATTEPTETPEPTPCPLVCSEPYPSIAAEPCTTNYLGIEPGCPFGYERAGNCCRPKPCQSPAPTPPPCDGTLTPPEPPFCRWVCLPNLPDPPPPDGSGGTEYTYSYCSSYYLIIDHLLCNPDNSCSLLYSETYYVGSTCMLLQ
jgi:hypothetical protein